MSHSEKVHYGDDATTVVQKKIQIKGNVSPIGHVDLLPTV